MPKKGEVGELHLKGKPVGEVIVRRQDGSWTYADFRPGEGFSEFAMLFGSWALLIHADADEERLSAAASKELRNLENQIDALKAQVFFPGRGEWKELAQINIDHGTAEWKEY